MVQRTCEHCGSQFSTYQAEVRKGGGRYCSRSCAAPYKRKGYRTSPETRARISAAKKGKEAWNKGQTEMQRTMCAQCGNAFPHKACQRRRFCSEACDYAYRAAHPDLRNPRWRGGTSKFYGPNWRQQAEAARKRDGYTCQHCGLHRRNPRLSVHHLRPRRLFNGDYAAMNALDNLITLCQPCHVAAENVLTPLVLIEREAHR